SSPQFEPGAGEDDGDSLDIVCPLLLWSGTVIQIEGEFLIKLFRVDSDSAILSRRNCDPGACVDRSRHYEAIVVVSVLPDEVDSWRGTNDGGLSAEAALETRLQSGRKAWLSLRGNCIVRLCQAERIVSHEGQQSSCCHILIEASAHLLLLQ